MSEQLILILEDDDNIGQVMQLILDMEGFKTKIVKTNADAIKAMDLRPAAVLVDYQLETETAEPFADFVGKRFPAVPLVLVTARSNPDVIAQTLRINRLLKKPFDIETLVKTICDAIK